nr:hypothetical protein [Microvirga massiliensis]
MLLDCGLTQKLQHEIDGGVTAADIVVEIGVDPLVAQIDIWTGRDQQHVAVECGEIVAATQPVETQRRWTIIDTTLNAEPHRVDRSRQQATKLLRRNM